MRIFTLLTLVFLCAYLKAQDTLFYTNGSHVVGQIEEIGVDQVRYRTNSVGNSILIVAEKKELARIKLGNGLEVLITAQEEEKGLSPKYISRKQAVSMDVLAPALDHFVFGYERVIGTRMNLCIRAGYIGLGIDRGNDGGYFDPLPRVEGAMLKIGVKFKQQTPPRRYHNILDDHPLAGFYLRPELILNTWSQTERAYYGFPYSTKTTRVEYTNVAFNLVIGKQLMLGERVTFDLSAGLGYGTQFINGSLANTSGADNFNRVGYAYSHAYLGDRNPLVISGGMLFGYAF